MNPRVFRFLAVGAIGFSVQTAVLAALVNGARWPTLLATAVAVEAAILTNFLWHERWTWRDRQPEGRRAHRLWRFHVANGITSIAGNVAIVSIGVGLLHVNPLTANALAVALLSAANYVMADRWAFARRGVAVGALTVIATAATSDATELKPETLAAWNQHVREVEAGLPAHEHDRPIAEPQGQTIDVSSGTIHEWRGSILVPDTTVESLVDALLNPGSRPPQEDVAASRVLARNGDSLLIYLRLVRRVIVTATFDTEHEVSYVRRSPGFATSRSVATRIEETGGSDRGFLWRLNSYWRYRQVGSGVQIDLLSLSLSRGIPWIVRPVAAPLIQRIGRESLNRTLGTIELTAASLPKPGTVMAGRVIGR